MEADFIAFFRAAFLTQQPQRYAVMQPQQADRKYNDYAGALTDTQIAAHLAGHTTYAVPTTEHGLASYLPLDIDAGGIAAIHALMQATTQRGLWSFGQYHPERERGYVWIPFDDLVNTERIRRLGNELIAQVQRPGWKIENRATNEDTRLPLARHQWTGKHGELVIDGVRSSIDADPAAAVVQLAAVYRENPTSQLPPPPESATPRSTSIPSAQGITIATYNSATDLVHLLESYGAKRSRGQGARLYFCPFHDDNHASLLISKNGEHCRCMSAGSDCALSGHQYDAFNVLCIGERLTPAQALRRLNGLPDDPEPGGSGNGPQTPPATPGRSTQQSEADSPRQAHSAPQRSTEQTPAPRPQLQHNSSDLRLPKTCRCVLDVFTQASGHYWRGVPHLAKALDVDPRTVQRSLRRLEAEQLVERQQRGDGHTDIYRLVGGGVAKRVNIPDEPASAPEGGWQMPPTVIHEISVQEDSEARRGGISDTPFCCDEAAPVLEADADGAYCGPAGAVGFVGGAAYVPPQATSWYNLLTQVERPAPEREPEQIALPMSEAEPQAEPELRRPGARKRRRGRKKLTQPGQLVGRIIAAERKAAKLERGNASERRQAAAIRRQVEHMQRRQERAREQQAVQWYDATACDQWLEAQGTGGGPVLAETIPAPPSSSACEDYAITSRGLVSRLRALRQQAVGAAEGCPPSSSPVVS